MRELGPKQTSESEIKTKTVSRNRFSETGIFPPGFNTNLCRLKTFAKHLLINDILRRSKSDYLHADLFLNLTS